MAVTYWRGRWDRNVRIGRVWVAYGPLVSWGWIDWLVRRRHGMIYAALFVGKRHVTVWITC